MTILDIAQSMKGRLRDGLSQTQSGTQPGESEVAFGTAAADSSGGFVSIIMDGAPTDDPGYDPADYTFEVPCDSPITAGDRVSYISDAGRGKAVSVATLTQIAQDADAIATATDQHFWADSGGVHVSTDEDDPAGAQNIIMNSAGVLLREGSDYLAAFTPSAVAFYDGNGNTADNITASFGSSGAIVGSSDSSTAVITSDGLTLYDDGGTIITEMVKGVTPQSQGIIADFQCSGMETRSLVLTYTPQGGATIYVRPWSNNVLGTQVTFTYGTSAGPENIVVSGTTYGTLSYDGSVTFTYEPIADIGANSKLRFSYPTSSYYPPHFTLGIASGTPGDFSVAMGLGIDVTNAYAVGTGAYNDVTNAPLFSVGNGGADNMRSNAFEVDSYGNVRMGQPLAISYGGSGQSGTSTDTAAAGIITAGTYITVTGASYSTWGKVAQLLVTFTRSSAISANQNFTVGTVASGKRPVHTAGGSSNSFVGWLTDTGTLTVRNVTGAQIAANTTVYISFTYLLP